MTQEKQNEKNSYFGGEFVSAEKLDLNLTLIRDQIMQSEAKNFARIVKLSCDDAGYDKSIFLSMLIAEFSEQDS